MGTKIQINSLKALEQLLHANPEVKMEIRKSVLKEYEKKHALPSIVARIEELSRKEVDGLMGSTSYYGTHTLKKKHKDLIKEMVNAQVSSQLHKIVAELFGEACLPEKITGMVEKQVTDEVLRQTRVDVQDRIKKSLK